MAKLWSEYKTTNFDLVKQEFVKLSELGDRIGEYEEKEENIWYIIDYIARIIEDNDENPDWFLERNCLSLLDVGLTADLVLLAEDLEKASENVKGVKVNASVPLPESIRSFSKLYINKETIDTIFSVYSSLGQEERRTFSLRIEDVVENLNLLYQQLTILGGVLGLFSTLENYNIEGTKQFFEGKENSCDALCIVKTICESRFGGEYSRDVTLGAINFLTVAGKKQNPEFEWTGMFMYSLMINYLFERFNYLPQEYYEILLKQYLYKAIAVGVPVRRKMQDFLKNTPGIIEYLNYCKEFIIALKKNEEMILVGGQEKKIVDLVKVYISRLGDVQSGYEFENYVKEQFKNEANKEYYIPWLREFFLIYLKSRDATILDWVKERNVPVKEAAEDKIFKLLASFALNMKFEYIVKYLKEQPEGENRLSDLMYTLERVAKLDDERNVESAVNLSKVLQANKIIEEDKDLVYFDEEEGTFKWNEEFLS